MRKLAFYLLFVGILLDSKLYSQCSDCAYKSDEIWISVENEQGFQLAKGSFKTNDPQLNDVFIKYETQQLEQVFPYSRIDRLKKLYKIKFKGNRDELISELQNNKGIKRIIKRPVENQIALYEPSDYMWYLPTQQDPNGWLWHLKRIQAANAWDITKGDANIKIASLDTWFDINHPDLTIKIFPKYDPYDNTTYNSDCLKNNHGTTAVSFIAAETDGGGQLASIGFKCMLICYQAWDQNYIERAHHASLAMNANVITSSAGGWTCTSAIDEDEKLAVKEILDNGTIIVMPAGNGTTGTRCNYNGSDHAFKPLSPEYDERVILVSSTNINDNHQYFSNGVDHTHSHYPEVDICAPGYDIMGAACTQSKDASNNCIVNNWPYYGSYGGTSFSTPIVAGVCALMKSINPCLTPALAQSIIKSTADPITDASLYPGLVGAGRINAYKCVMIAGTKSISGDLSGSVTYSAGYAINMNNATIQNNANINIQARKEINIGGPFEVQLGSSANFTIDENSVNSCN